MALAFAADCAKVQLLQRVAIDDIEREIHEGDVLCSPEHTTGVASESA
ncbi:MAG: hypothetical protein QOF51_3506 [Chloroflexota bacterium]|jgi:hypothetical protein|nr:hypothetical protein [Chloroflexota bacterium]